MSTAAIEPRVKGSMLATRPLWVRFNRGEDGLRELEARLEPTLARVVRDGIDKATWYPFSWFLDLNVAIDEVFGSGDLSLVPELGRHGTETNLTTIYRVFYKVGTPRWILSRAGRLWRMHFDAGRLAVRLRTETVVDLAIVDFPTPHRAHCLSILGTIERSAELSGAEGVRAQELSCRAAGEKRCVLRVAWQ